VPFSKELVETFKRYFEAVRQHNDKPTIGNPFFFLSRDGFWNVIPNSGGKPLYEPGNATAGPSIGTLKRTHGEFNKQLWDDFLTNRKTRAQLREALVARYFPEFRQKLSALVGQRKSEPVAAFAEEPPRRDAAFRTTILEIYDYRCSACGVRVRLNEMLTLVQAAHIIPFSESRNDKPDNGLALCPNHHWAMDRALIAPCPCPQKQHRAGVWRVSPLLDDRIDDQKDLLALNDRPVIKPVEEKFYPAEENLKWRETFLMGLRKYD
jgi:putative restriction endonuclease